MKHLPFLFAAILVSGCSNYTMSTNLDKENFVEYFKPDKVTIISKTELQTLNYIDVDMVEGEACQEKSHYAEPTDAEARTDARRKAADLGANAIVFQDCVMTEPSNDTCYKVKLCFGRAVKITEDDLKALKANQ